MVEQGVSKELIAKQVEHTDTTMMERVYAQFTNNMDKALKEAILKSTII